MWNETGLYFLFYADFAKMFGEIFQAWVFLLVFFFSNEKDVIKQMV